MVTGSRRCNIFQSVITILRQKKIGEEGDLDTWWTFVDVSMILS